MANLVEVNFISVSGDDKLQDKSIDEVNHSLREYMIELSLELTKITEQSELLQSKINFIENKFNDIKIKKNK